jgi:hypothetical protein
VRLPLQEAVDGLDAGVDALAEAAVDRDGLGDARRADVGFVVAVEGLARRPPPTIPSWSADSACN